MPLESKKIPPPLERKKYKNMDTNVADLTDHFHSHNPYVCRGGGERKMTETVQGLLRDYDRSVRPGYPGYPGGGGGLTVGVTVYVLAIPELNEETMVKSALSHTCTNANHLAIAPFE